MSCNKEHKTSIGGQAVIEGVMMRGPKLLATSVRKPDGEIITDIKPVKATNKKIAKLPIIRGCVNFFASMVTGVKCLMFSAEFFDIEEENAKPSKLDAWLEKTFGDKLKDYVIYFSVILSILLSVGLFILLPTFVAGLFKITSGFAKTFVEGVIRIALFVLYIALVAQMEDIKRVFMYHGAEHKSISCYEAGLEPTPDNARNCSRFHPRCGTSFLLIVMVISFVVFLLIPNDISWIGRFGFRILLLPVVAGLSYEIIKFAGRHNNKFTRIISAPGMWMQRFTTREPDDSMLEVAITSLKAVMPEDKEEAAW